MAPSWRSAAPVTVRPIVLVRGAVGDSDTFALTEGPLAERDTVWVYSRRGRGGSGDGPDYTYHREVEDVLAVLTAAGDRAHLSATPVARSTHCWPPRRHRRCGHSCSTSCRSSTTSTSASSTASLRCHGGQCPTGRPRGSTPSPTDRLTLECPVAVTLGRYLLHGVAEQAWPQRGALLKLVGEAIGGAGHLAAGRSSRLARLRSFTTEARCSGDSGPVSNASWHEVDAGTESSSVPRCQPPRNVGERAASTPACL
jgi:hypothetical protein